MSIVFRPLPAPVAAGARVGVMTLAGPVDPDRVSEGLALLRESGFSVVQAPNLHRRTGYLAGGDGERLAGLEALLDAGVDVLIAARGGYGTTRLLPDLPWERLEAWGGWVVGFSDVTALHAALSPRFPVATLHGPMVTTLGRDPESTGRLLRYLRGATPSELFDLAGTVVLRGGVAAGPAVGGNLSVLAALEGTPYRPSYEGAVLFLEDVGEPGYRLDRLLTQLRQTSALAGVRAVLAGELHRCGRDEPGFEARWHELLLEAAPAGAVVVAGLSFGHGTVNVPFPLGGGVEVDTRRGVVRWEGP